MSTLNIERVEVFGVASFYPMFKLRPVGKHLVSVCHNISCNLRGAEEILSTACQVAGAKPGVLTVSGMIEIEWSWLRK